jgi:hypothetical protein
MLPPSGPRHQQPVACLGAAAQDGSLRTRYAHQRHRDDELAGPRIRIAAGDGSVAGVGKLAHADVQLLGEPGRLGAARQPEADEGSDRPAAHGRDIAQVDRQRLAPHAPRAGFLEHEMAAVEEHIRGHEQARLEHRAVVAGADADPWMRRRAPPQPVDVVEISHGASPPPGGTHRKCDVQFFQ